MNDQLPPWQSLDKRTITSVRVAGVELLPGDRVRLRPRPGADVFDLVLQGKTATISSIEEDFDGRAHLAVTIDDDPGRDLGEDLQIGHRFFFSWTKSSRSAPAVRHDSAHPDRRHRQYLSGR